MQRLARDYRMYLDSDCSINMIQVLMRWCMQVTNSDLAGDFAILIFADPANYKAALENVSHLQDITELSGVLPAPHTRATSTRTLRCGMLCMCCTERQVSSMPDLGLFMQIRRATCRCCSPWSWTWEPASRRLGAALTRYSLDRRPKALSGLQDSLHAAAVLPACLAEQHSLTHSQVKHLGMVACCCDRAAF